MKRPSLDSHSAAVFGKLMAAALMIPTVHAQSPAVKSPLPMRDTATHDELILKLRQVSQEKPMAKLKEKTGADPSKVNQPESLLATSDILSFGELAVLVPKRAILQSPPKLADRMKLRPGSRFVSWTEFYAANRNWITTLEVNRTQAEGKEPVKAMDQKHIKESTNLIVAVYLGGPISVLPPVQPAETPATEITSTTPKP